MNRRTFIIVCAACAAVIVLVVALQIVSCSSTSATPVDEDTIVDNQESSSAQSSSASSSSSALGKEALSDATLSGSKNSDDVSTTENVDAADNVDDFEDATSDSQQENVNLFIEKLKEHPFVTPDGKGYLYFLDDRVVWEIYGYLCHDEKYNISDVSVETLTADDGVLLDRYTAKMFIDNVKYQLTCDTTDGGVIGNLTSPGFTENSVWIAKLNLEDIDVGDIIEDISLLIDGKNEEIKAFVVDYCHNFFPNVTSAIPLEKATTDYETNTVKIYYALSPIGGNQLIVTYDKNDGSFSASRG